MKSAWAVACILGATLVAGCASKGGASGADAPATGGPRGTTPAVGDAVSRGTGKAGIRDTVVYFDFDRADVRADQKELLDRWGEYLASNPKAALRLEGHADERGTREYNIGLGERRANAVFQALLTRGASQGQMSVVSYGEERPVGVAHDEAAWALNRRVELVD